MTHGNAPLSVEGRRRLVARCQSRPIAHVAAEMGISRACASKWVNRFRQFGELGLHDRSSAPSRQPTATPAHVIEVIEAMRRDRKWSAARIAFELNARGVVVSQRTVSRQLVALGLNRRRFLDPSGDLNRVPQRIIARRPGHMVHVDVKKVGRIPDGGGWRVHGKGSAQAKAVAVATAAGKRAGYVYLHSAVDGYSRLQTIRKVILPLAAPAVMANALYVFMIAWNEFLFALLFLVEDRDDWTVSLGLAQLKRLDGWVAARQKIARAYDRAHWPQGLAAVTRPQGCSVALGPMSGSSSCERNK